MSKEKSLSLKIPSETNIILSTAATQHDLRKIPFIQNILIEAAKNKQILENAIKLTNEKNINN